MDRSIEDRRLLNEAMTRGGPVEVIGVEECLSAALDHFAWEAPMMRESLGPDHEMSIKSQRTLELVRQELEHVRTVVAEFEDKADRLFKEETIDEWTKHVALSPIHQWTRYTGWRAEAFREYWQHLIGPFFLAPARHGVCLVAADEAEFQEQIDGNWMTVAAQAANVNVGAFETREEAYRFAAWCSPNLRGSNVVIPAEIVDRIVPVCECCDAIIADWRPEPLQGTPPQGTDSTYRLHGNASGAADQRASRVRAEVERMDMPLMRHRPGQEPPPHPTLDAARRGVTSRLAGRGRDANRIETSSGGFIAGS